MECSRTSYLVQYYHNVSDNPVLSSHRKIAGYMAFVDDQDYVAGHGSHVTGSLAGRMSGTKFGHPFFMHHGNAPGAKISFFDIGDSRGSLTTPDSLMDYVRI